MSHDHPANSRSLSLSKSHIRPMATISTYWQKFLFRRRLLLQYIQEILEATPQPQRTGGLYRRRE